MTTRGTKALLGESLAATFRARDWPRGPLLVHGPVRRFDSLLKAPELQSLPRLMAARHGKIMAERASGYIECDADTALRLYEGCQPIQVSGIGVGVPEVDRWTRAIAKDLGMPPIVDSVRANAFAAIAGGVRFPLHFDATDVIVVQLVGDKRWRLAPNPEVPYPTSGCGTFAPVLPGKDIRRYHYDGFPQPKRERTILLRPGSALYVPGGYWHGTETIGPSFSITFVLGRPSAHDLVLERIKAALSQNPAWLEPAVGIRGGARARRKAEARLGELLRHFDRDVGKLDARELIDGYLVRHRGIETQRFVPRPSASKRTSMRLTRNERPLAQWVSKRRRPFGLWDALSAAGTLNRPAAAELLARLVAAGHLTTA